MIKSPLAYSEAAELARLAGEEMLAQLPWMTIKPRLVLDIGCGIGEQSEALKQQYPDALVLGVDLLLDRLQQGKNKTSGIHWINAEGNRLPLRDQSVDCIFANFFLAWQPDLSPCWQEWLRVLRPDGLLMCNLFGPDTVKEWRVDFHDHWAPGMIDMHDAGDMLLQQGFCDPIVTVDYYTLNYQSSTAMIKELYLSDMLHTPFTLSQPDKEGKCAVTFEVVSAHAFAPAVTAQKTTEDGHVKIPLAVLRESLQKNRKVD